MGGCRDCGEGLVVVLDFISSRGVLVQHLERLLGLCLVGEVGRWTGREGVGLGWSSGSWGVTRLRLLNCGAHVRNGKLREAGVLPDIVMRGRSVFLLPCHLFSQSRMG